MIEHPGNPVPSSPGLSNRNDLPEDMRMRISVKLMATLRNRLPPEAKGTARFDFEPGATVQTVLDKLGISAGTAHLLMINDSMETDRSRQLADGDRVVLIPPVAGGTFEDLDTTF